MQQKFTTLVNMVQYMLQTYRNSYALNYRVEGEWRAMSTEFLVESVRRLTLGLWDLGLRPGERVGILAKPSPYWLICDLAILSAGGVSVPLFAYVSENNFIHEVNDSEMKMLFVVDSDQWAAASHHCHRFDSVVVHNVADFREADNVHGMQQLLERGDQVSRKQPALYAEMRDRVQEDDLATIIYTSGSTGIPKGVELTHGNFISQLVDSNKRFRFDPKKDRVLSSLPLAHAFERMLMYYYLSSGVSVYFVDDIRNLGELMQEVNPTHAAMVPLMVEKIYAKMESEVKRLPFPLRNIGLRALQLAKRPTCTGLCALERGLYSRFLYRKLRESMGGSFEAILVGGAPLNKDLNQFFLSIGVPMYQGYGLTESSPVLAVNYPNHNKPGTVGPAFPSVKIRISESSEILAKGPNIMRGYHNDAKSTSVRIDEEGWLHTGDQGFIDEHGFLTVTGRLKEIFKLSSGKMVSPLPIEQALCEDSFIDMALVVGHARKYPTALLVANKDEVKELMRETKLDYLSLEDFLDSPPVQRLTDKVLDRVNAGLNEWERLRGYKYFSVPLTMESGELTATMKIRRQVVTDKYTDLIDSMY